MMKKTGCKSLLLVTLVMVLGLLTSCSETAVYRYRFSPATGFQEEDGDIWYEMSDAPMVIQKEEGTITIKNIIWKEKTVITEVEFDNIELDEDTSDVVRIYTEDQSKTQRSHSGGLSIEENATTNIRNEFTYKYPADEIALDILGEKYTVKMQPIGQYEDFEDIGMHQPHSGRTIVLQKEYNGDIEKLKAYTYSEDVWKITSIGDLPTLDWGISRLTGGYVMEYLGNDVADLDSIDVDNVCIVSEEDVPLIPLDIPENDMEVDIPFYVGEDCYHITEIRVVHGTYAYTVGDTDETSTTKYGDEVLIKIEPVAIEENTEVFGIKATLGTEKTSGVWVYSSQTGESEVRNVETAFIPMKDNLFNQYFLDNNYQTTETIIRLGFTDREEIPEKAMLRIDRVSKFWKQNYHFDLK